MPRTVTEYSDDELGLNAGWDDHLDPNIRRELREGRIVRREHKEATEKLEAVERELTLYKAGIPADKRGVVFAQTYEGKSDPDAIRAAYEELFGPLAEGGTGEGGGTEDPAANARKIATAGNEGGGSGAPGTVDLADAIRGAKTEAEVLEIIRQASIHNPEAHVRLPEE